MKVAELMRTDVKTVDLDATVGDAITTLRVKASAEVGPDLTYAYGDVLHRYGLNLESFMADPTGVMRMMLASHIRLTVADRDSIVRLLRELYEERGADSEAAMPSLPPTRPGPTAGR